MPELIQILVTLTLALGIFLLIYGVFRFPVPAERPVHRRIAEAMGQHRQTVFEQPLMAPVMSLGLALAHRFNVPALRQRVRRDLEAAGNPSGYSVEEYLAICLLSGAVLAIASGALELMLGSSMALLIVPIMAVVGFAIPLWTLRSAAQRRLARVAKQLPYTLDLVALVMGAGSSFTEAVETLIRDNPDDDLNQELRIVLSEIEFGTTRATALQNLAERIPLESLRSVVGAVVQAERLGTPLSSILKMQADVLRNQRSVRAEKLAASASLRILLPSTLILLAVVLIVFAPIILRWIQGTLL
ncbi:MAG: type II secretion system F family protein [Phycisphaeraceae bacterium]